MACHRRVRRLLLAQGARGLKRDVKKTDALRKEGWTVLRIREDLDDIPNAINIPISRGLSESEIAARVITTAIQNRIPCPITAAEYRHAHAKRGPAPSNHTPGRPLTGTSLADLRPDLAVQWHPRRNGDCRPEHVTAHSGKKVWWHCPACGHQWAAIVNNRSKGHGCRLCGSKASSAWRSSPKPGQSIAELHPELAAQWLRGPDSQPDLMPEQVKPGSNQKVWWRCPACGHQWAASVNDRSRGKRCLECFRVRRERPKPGESLADLHPGLAAQWLRGPDANPDLPPHGSNPAAWPGRGGAAQTVDTNGKPPSATEATAPAARNVGALAAAVLHSGQTVYLEDEAMTNDIHDTTARQRRGGRGVIPTRRARIFVSACTPKGEIADRALREGFGSY